VGPNDDSLIATALDPLRHSVLVDDRYAAMAVTRIVVSPIAVAVAAMVMVMVSYAHANWTDADVRVLSMGRNRDCNSGGRQQSNRQRSHL